MVSLKAERVLILLAILSLTIVMFPRNFRLLWNSLVLAKRVKIDSEWRGSEWPGYPLWVVVVTPTGAELILSAEELDKYQTSHADYSFLIPSGLEKAVESQISSSRRKKCPGCKAEPTLSVKRIDSAHQLIELYLHGDPHDEIFWYQASDKEILPKYWTMMGIPDAFLVLILDVLFIPGLYLIAQFVARVVSRWFMRPISVTTPS